MGQRGIAIYRTTFAAVFLCALVSGCPIPIPDQSGYADLDSLAVPGIAVVRLYSAPILGLESVATHPWFVVKCADASAFDRWEVWPHDDMEACADERHGHVYRNLNTLEGEAGGGVAFVVAEEIGARAEAIVEFIQSQSASYPGQLCYAYIPGPNSNTYAQWVIDETHWDVALPEQAIGRDAPQSCDKLPLDVTPYELIASPRTLPGHECPVASSAE